MSFSAFSSSTNDLYARGISVAFTRMVPEELRRTEVSSSWQMRALEISGSYSAYPMAWAALRRFTWCPIEPFMETLVILM